MRCERIREMLEESGAGAVSAEVRTHLASCPGCAAYARDWQAVSEGFELLKSAPAAEPSVGFTARLMRRLEQPAPALVQDFFEAVGRRFVHATFVLAVVAVLALALPSSGPLRGPTTSEVLLAQPEVTMATADPMIYGFESGFAAPLFDAREMGGDDPR